MVYEGSLADAPGWHALSVADDAPEPKMVPVSEIAARARAAREVAVEAAYRDSMPGFMKAFTPLTVQERRARSDRRDAEARASFETRNTALTSLRRSLSKVAEFGLGGFRPLRPISL